MHVSSLLLPLLLSVALGAPHAMPSDVGSDDAQAAADTAQESSVRWFRVEVGGAKIGHLRQHRFNPDNRVFTESEMTLTLARGDQPLVIRSRQLSVESPQGDPLGFESELESDGSVTRVVGRRRESGRFEVDLFSPNDPPATDPTLPPRNRQIIEWPAQALLAEGLRLTLLRDGFDPAARYLRQVFDFAAVGARTTLYSHRGFEQVTLPEGPARLLRIDESTGTTAGPHASSSWWDPETGQMLRRRLRAMGLELDLLACDRACALAPDEPVDVIARMQVPAPRVLSRRELRRPLRYAMRVDGGADTLQLESPSVANNSTPGTRFDGGAFVLDVDPTTSPTSANLQPPDDHDLLPNRWLQSSHPEINAMAERLSRGRRGDATRMQALEAGVRQHITRKNLRIGYASALETLRSREGDCTEHAVLLAALGRASGIPTRVATGLAYSRENGHAPRFVPHAWVYAWIDGQWIGFDAAMDGFGSGHIALSAGDGDPYRYFGNMDLLGRLSIDSVERG